MKRRIILEVFFMKKIIKLQPLQLFNVFILIQLLYITNKGANKFQIKLKT